MGPVTTKKNESEFKEGDLPLQKTGEGVWSFSKEGYGIEIRKGLKGPSVVETFRIAHPKLMKEFEGELRRKIVFNGSKISEVAFEFSQKEGKPFPIATIGIDKEYENMKESRHRDVESIITKKIKIRAIDELQFEVGLIIDESTKFAGRGFGLISFNISSKSFGANGKEERVVPLENDYRTKVTLHKEEAIMKSFLKKAENLVT